MVEVQTNDTEERLILSPNRSMSWQTNKRILLAMFLVNMLIALGWTAMGAWMVLPFAGLEILLVGIGMYYVSWKLSFKEILILEADSLIIQKGVYYPKQEWHWQRSNSSLLKQPSRYRMTAPTLYLRHLNEEVEIGAFLNRSEKKLLREHLTKFGIALSLKPPR